MSRGVGRAGTILERLLFVLPLAFREEGVEIDTLARDLDVDPHRILRDLEVLQSRSYYLPPGTGDQIQLQITGDRISVWTTGEFRRPVRLGPREGLALELALRVAARDASARDRSGFETLRKKVVDSLRSPAPEDAEDPAVALGGVEGDGDPIREAVEEALRERTELRIVYRRPGREPAPRRVGPLVLAHAEGRWYLLARDLAREGLRAFRLDRILDARREAAAFVPSDEDEAAVEGFFGDGRIHDGGGPDAPEPFEAVVDYGARIARWIRERGWDEVEVLEDGGLRVRHRVVDPEWLLRHVLSYGAAARIVEPEWMRKHVVEAAAAIVRSGPDAASVP